VRTEIGLGARLVEGAVAGLDGEEPFSDARDLEGDQRRGGGWGSDLHLREEYKQWNAR
jgi:hypothetical protein